MSNNAVTINKVSNNQQQAWDNYVNRHPEGTFFHLFGWKLVIEQAYSHETCYLVANQGERIVGVLPLGHINSRLFGNALISNPFCVYGGAIADNDAVRGQLETAAEQEALKRNVDFLELRNLRITQKDWLVKELYYTFRKEIDQDPEVNMNAIPRKQRAMVRKGIKAGLSSHIEEEIDTFFKIYSTSVRNHGTPVFPKKYFRLLKHVFGDQCEVRVVNSGDESISTVMSFYFRDEVLPYYGGGLPVARSVKAFDYMYWDLMQTVCQRGIRIYDYGRSKKGTGSYSFKKNWGFVPKPLPYQYRLVKSNEMPEINPLNPKYQLFIKAWRRLPLPLANAIGPWLAKNLG
jgi:FemAB-related protein (PEP-CTERM system-associated)